MALPGARSVIWLAIAVHAGAFAQVPVKPGKWELTSTFRGLPFGDSAKPARTACISAAELGSIPEKALMSAAPAPADDGSRAPPKCAYSNIRREGAQSSWALACEGPTMSGSGNATVMPEAADLSETFKLETPFGSHSIQHIVLARRQGDCL
ncbi:DUF3617 family protein [Trinickia terrae]|uniref:DUF3617 family protein n=1 Tax=Trinickia terrae TaxID=2571161 RepID=A0A4U1I101_9BURK|nr:DUF3617 family protein [Trinickia terrae]TKC86821.1 DUF3617 family protein [Trinickia terrae]